MTLEHEMKIPQKPPGINALFAKTDASSFGRIIELVQNREFNANYVHWDKLRRLPPPKGHTAEEWWLALKMARKGMLRPISLKDKCGAPFQFCVPELVQEALHSIDMGAGSSIGVPEPITNPQTKDRYLIRSLMEEAITSSQLEGAVTTREVAKEMIRSGRPPRDNSEQMILNNYLTMLEITHLKDRSLTPEMVFEIHRKVTKETLEDPTAAGRFRRSDEIRVVRDDYGVVFHEPPLAEQLDARLNAMCDFANGNSPDFFVHPVVRAIILHFWLAYDHPFIDGNGRTARALFYWSMLHGGYWLFEFVSISNILRKAPSKYARAFLCTETDDNDLTYFIVAQVEVIQKAIEALHEYINAKTAEVQQLESHVRALNLFNHRQGVLILHALKHPYQHYTFTSHQMSHNVVYQTARLDLLDLHKHGLLVKRKRGKEMEFTVPADLGDRLRKLEKDARG